MRKHVQCLYRFLLHAVQCIASLFGYAVINTNISTERKIAENSF
jgi:hypothetical protein